MNEFRLILQDATNYGFWNFIGYLMLLAIPVQGLLYIIAIIFKRQKK